MSLCFENNSESMRLNQTEKNNADATFIVKQIKIKTFSPSHCLLTFPPCTLSKQVPILFDCRRRLEDSKHNKTFRSISMRCGKESILYCAEFFGGNLQLPSACESSLRWNIFISSLHPSCPHQRPTSCSGGCSSTADHDIRAPWGDPSKLQ